MPIEPVLIWRSRSFESVESESESWYFRGYTLWVLQWQNLGLLVCTVSPPFCKLREGKIAQNDEYFYVL